jgi:hypothetical protein
MMMMMIIVVMKMWLLYVLFHFVEPMNRMHFFRSRAYFIGVIFYPCQG